MYRGRPPPRGGYPPSFEGRGPPPPRSYPASSYRDDRNRPRRPYHPEYHDHVHPDSYRRSPPRRRYPSPGTGSHRSGEYWSGGPPRERSPSPRGPTPVDRNLVVTVGNKLNGPPGTASSRHHDRDYPPRPEYEPSRSRGRSRGRSPDRSRAKSRGRSKSRPRSKSPSPDRSRAKSRGRSKSRPRSRSRSRSRGRSRGRSYSKATSQGRSKSRQRSRGRSTSSSSSSSSGYVRSKRSRKTFKELQTARRRKELEDMLSLPTKSILKKRTDSEDSPSLLSSDSPRALESSNISQVADQFLLAVKGMEPHKVASMLSELQSDPQMAQRAGFNSEIKEILHLLGGQAVGAGAQEKTVDDIDDEEKFLYGDSEEPKPPPAPEPLRQHGLNLYGDVTEEVLYEDYPPQKAVLPPPYGVLPRASSHLQTPPTMGEVNVRYSSQHTIGSDQNITVQVPNTAYLPGTEPLEESERKALEEYEKMQDLLKTIGLDLGVAEISKMAARTKERLHGTKPPPKTPTRRRRYSSSSSDSSGCKRRSHSGSSSSRSSSSRSHSRGRGGRRRDRWSSDDEGGKNSAPPTSKKDKDATESKAEQSEAGPPPQKSADPNTFPRFPGMPIPTFTPPQVHGMMPPNFPPPGYNQYGNYLPYMQQQWPPMFPPNMSLPPQTSPNNFPNTQPYAKPASEPVAKGCRQDSETGKASSHDLRVSEEQNNESQKQKVLEEREKLKEDRDLRMKKKEYLIKELERLRKQQGELLRKKRREKGGHKDPLLQEISLLQEEVMTQISNLRKEHEAAEKKRNEIDKVALILGLSPFDRPRKTNKPAEEKEDEPPTPSEKEKAEAQRSPEGQQEPSSSTKKQTSAGSRSSPDKPPVSTTAPPPAPPPEPFEYYDAGNHWCKNCNVTSGSMFDFFTHLHNKSHRKTLDPYDRPWASVPTKISKNSTSEEKLTKPAKGSEFLLPVRGFFCLLCKEFFGDAICAEEHVTTHAHNEKYKKQMYENPLYEQRRNLDRQAGLSSEASGKKRKHEDEDKRNEDKEEKSEHKKERKDKEKHKEEDEALQKEEKMYIIKDEVEEKTRKETVYKGAKILDDERPCYSKRDEDEKYKKKDDKFRHSREEEDRGKFSRRDDDDRYKYREEEYRHRFNREEGDRYDNRSKYGPKEDEDKYKYGKYSDFRPKYEPKAGKETVKEFESGKPVGKPEFSKPEPPPKPYDPPKILCGPSPAMRAKLRKQSLETSKPAPVATSFGRFTWKKKENVLAKEAQKVAAEFIKDDEAAMKQKPISAEESFAKSIAVAKEIAEKLGGQNMPPPWVSNNANPGRIRPNLPAPPAVLRKTAMMGKPAPLNTFLSIRPQNTTLVGAPLPIFPDPHTNDQHLQNAVSQTKPQSPLGRPGACVPAPEVPSPKLFEPAPSGTTFFSPSTTLAPPGTTSVPRVSTPAPPGTTPAPPGTTPAPPGTTPAPPGTTPAPPGTTPAPPGTTPAPPGTTPAPPVSKSIFPVSTPAPPGTTPAPPVSKYIFPVSIPAPPGTTPAPPGTTSAPPVSKHVPVNLKPVVSEAKPLLPLAKSATSATAPVLSTTKLAQPTLIKIVSDVAAPGVPESEQIHAVFVKPPPFMSKAEGLQKSEKPKRNLATAKAQDLFDIFYSRVSQPGTSSITKPAVDSTANGSSTNKIQLPAPQAQKPQPQCQPLAQSAPPAVVCTSPQPDSNNPPSPQNESDILIASVWSMQSPPAPSAEEGPSKTTSQTSHPKLNPPDQSGPESAPQNQSSSPQCDSHITPQIEPPKPTPQNQSSSPKSDSHITPQIELPKPTPQNQTEPQSESQPDLDSQPPSHSYTAPEPEQKPGPKTRGKRTPPAARPVRQTRSQTRYQTRQQQQQHQQSQSDPEPASGESNSAASDTSDPSSGANPEEGANEVDQMMEITPETLGLPSDMTSLNFETDFNFE